MQAIVRKEYGPPDALRLEDVEKPLPNENQVLVKVFASSVNAGDYRVLRGNPLLVRLIGGGLRQPKDPRFGSDLAGRVEAVGENVKDFRVGDEVFGCGKGAFAEYVLTRESYLALKPANRSFEEAAAVPVAALTALQGLRDAGKIQAGQKVLIQGASGGVGIFSVQLAKYFGGEVTAVCSTRNLEMVRSLGADHVIDYTMEDFTKNGKQYDLILAVNGYHSIFDYKRSLCPQGMYICAGGSLAQFFQVASLGSLLSKEGGKKLRSMGIAKVNHQDLAFLGQLLETGKIIPVIDRRYPLSETVAAILYVEEKHAQGKVVINIV